MTASPTNMDGPDISPRIGDSVDEGLSDRVAALPGGEELAGQVRSLAERCATTERMLKRQDITHRTIIEIASRVNASGLDLRRIEAYTASMVRGQFGVLRVFLWRADVGEEGQIRITVPNRDALGGLAFASDGAFGRWLVANPSPLGPDSLSKLADQFHEAQQLREGGVHVALPLVHTGSDGRSDLVGVLGLGEKIRRVAFSEADLELLEALSNMIAIALHNAHLYHRSIVDGLTRVYSRGHFDAHLGQEISRARRHLRQQKEQRKTGADATRLSLVLVDIDHFKKVNDIYGHQTGDAVLRAVGGMLMEAVRAMDIVSRYGGEEFAVTFPDTRRDDALRVAERLREGFAELGCTTPGGEPLLVTASFGVATWPDDAEDMRGLVAAADKALYRAKHGGRNRVVSAADDPEREDG